MINIFTATEGQTVFDLGINLYTDLDNVINLLQSSNIDNVNESDLNQKVLNYDTDLISDFIVYKYIFSKRKRFNTGVVFREIVLENTYQIWKDVNGVYWLVTIDSNNIVSSVETSPVIDYISNQLWMDSNSEYWTVTIDTNGIFEPINEGYGTPILSSIWVLNNQEYIQTIDLNGIFQFN